MLATITPHEVEGLAPHNRNSSSYVGGARLLMPATDLTSIDANARRRVPKLAVRHRISEDESFSSNADSMRPDVVRETRPPLSSHSSEKTVAPAFERSQSDQSQDSLDRLRRRDSGNALSKGHSGQNGKKKKGGVLGFLTLKEPSTSAWEEFAEAQKKLAAQKGGRINTVGMTGLSSQKMPGYVPPVNSKWDGLPENAKRKGTDIKSKRMNNRDSIISSSTRYTSRTGISSYSAGSGDKSPARRFGSLSSKPSTVHSKHSSLQSFTSTDEPRRVAYRSPPSTAARPPMHDSAITPWEMEEPPQSSDEGDQQEADESQKSFLRPPSPSIEPSSLLPTPELELPDIFSSPEPSPQTPPVQDTQQLFASLAGQHDDARLVDRTSPVCASGTCWHSDTDTEDAGRKPIVRSSQLRPPPNFSRPRVPHSSLPATDDDLPSEPTIDEVSDEGESFLPTLRDEKGRTSPFIFDPSVAAAGVTTPMSTVVPGRRESTSSRLTTLTNATVTTATQPLHSPTFSIDLSESTRPSTAASTATAQHRPSLSPVRSNSDADSIAPSEMSAQWNMSPKERLGLGSRVTRRSDEDVLPWDASNQGRTSVMSDVSTKRQSVASQVTLEGSKLKRLSLKLGRK